jgi:hypothetical protein
MRNLKISVIPNDFERARNRTLLPTAQTFIQHRSFGIKPVFAAAEAMLQPEGFWGIWCFWIVIPNNFERVRNWTQLFHAQTFIQYRSKPAFFSIKLVSGIQHASRA